MDYKIKIDLPERTEKRYILLNPEEFLERISPFVEEIKFSNNEYVQTIYLNNEEHNIPFEHSVKARKYLPHPSDSPFLDGIYYLDLKKGIGENKQKKRLEADLGKIVEIVNKEYPFSIPLKPYTAVEYLRHHYIPKNTENIRLTIDTNLRYFFFPLDIKKGIEIGRENYTRLEIKEKEQDKEFNNIFDKILKETNAFPIISKKSKSYSFLGGYYTKTFGKPLYKELKGYEIESKLETESNIIFEDMKNIFRRSAYGFELPNHFPFTIESASINRYYEYDGIIFKAMLIGNEAKIVKKKKKEL